MQNKKNKMSKDKKLNNNSIEKKKRKKMIHEKFDEYQKTRSKELRDFLIEQHLYIAEILAKKYLNKGIDYDDIFQIASMGLIYAVERFDPSKGFEFSSYATPTIIGEIKKYFRDKGWSIKVPRKVQENSKKINNAKVYLSQVMQESPTVKDIADYLGISSDEVLETMEASKVYQPQSLDVQLENSQDDRSAYLGDLVGKEDTNFKEVENNDYINKVLAKLSELERNIIQGRYIDGKTQISISKELGISQMTVSRIENKVLRKLKKELNKEDFY